MVPMEFVSARSLTCALLVVLLPVSLCVGQMLKSK